MPRVLQPPPSTLQIRKGAEPAVISLPYECLYNLSDGQFAALNRAIARLFAEAPAHGLAVVYEHDMTRMCEVFKIGIAKREAE